MGPKLLKLKNYEFQKILGHKKIVGSRKFWVTKKIVGSRKFWVMKIIRSWKISDHEKFWVNGKFCVMKYRLWKKSSEIFDAKKILCQIKFWKEILGPEKILDPKNLCLKKFTIPKIFHHRKFCVTKNFVFQKFLCLKKI